MSMLAISDKVSLFNLASMILQEQWPFCGVDMLQFKLPLQIYHSQRTKRRVGQDGTRTKIYATQSIGSQKWRIGAIQYIIWSEFVTRSADTATAGSQLGNTPPAQFDSFSGYIEDRWLHTQKDFSISYLCVFPTGQCPTATDQSDNTRYHQKKTRFRDIEAILPSNLRPSSWAK